MHRNAVPIQCSKEQTTFRSESGRHNHDNLRGVRGDDAVLGPLVPATVIRCAGVHDVTVDINREPSPISVGLAEQAGTDGQTSRPLVVFN